MNTLYTFGYLSSKSRRILRELIAVRTPVVDVRYKPESKRWEWTQDALKVTPNLIYYWIKELGNEQYREALNGKFQEVQIKLHDPEKGLIELDKVISKYKRAAIFCACNSKECHRFKVAELAKEKLGVKIVHL